MRIAAYSLLVAGLTTVAAAQGPDWAPASGLATGRVSVLRTNDVRPSVLWAAGSGGVFVSTDGGRSWALKTASLPDPAQAGVKNRAMDVDRRNPDVAYAGLGTATYRTTDGGASWSPVLAGAVDVALALDPAHPGDFYGVSWAFDIACFSRFSGGSSNFLACNMSRGPWFAVDPTNTDTLYESSNFKSVDGGKTWITLPSPIPYSSLFDSVLVDETGVVWTGGHGPWSGGIGPRVSRSVDGGITWTDLSGNLPALTSRACEVYDLALSPTHPGTLVVALYDGGAASGFYRTIDWGAHWYRIGGPQEAFAVAFAGANSETLVGGTLHGGVVTIDANPPAAPSSIADVSPSTGSMEGGTLVLISGSGFTPYSWVEIGGRPTTDFTFFDASTIRVRTTAHTVGLGDVVVRNADGGIAAKASAFGFENWAGPSVSSPAPCDPGQGLCLENGRFLAIVSRRNSTIVPSSHPVTLSQKSGYFWFDYSPSVDVVIKILDGRTLDGHYWIHWSVLSDEAVSIMIIDRLDLKTFFLDKPAGGAAAGIDKTTF